MMENNVDLYNCAQTKTNRSWVCFKISERRQCSTVGGHFASAKPCSHAARKLSFKRERFLVTLCHQKGRFPTAITTSPQSERLLVREKCGLEGWSPDAQLPASWRATP